MYWFFRPAWQVKSALWNELFGEHDPAITIARYAKLSFKSPSDFRKPLILDDGDVLIITSLVEHLKNCLRYSGKIEPEHLRPILAAAMGAEHLFPDRFLNHNFPFEAVFRSAMSVKGLPHWVAQYILQFWGRSLDETYGNDLSHIDAPTKDSIVEQAQLVGGVLLGYVVGENDAAAKDLPGLEYISDRSFTEALHTIDWLNVELNIPDLQHLFSSILEATDRARVRKFGGRLPFSLYDASSLYEQANLETWTSEIASYTSDKYDDVIDRYSCTYPQNVSWSAFEERRGNRSAIQRYSYYRKTLDEFTGDGLEELACAWWSFFIASQVFTFGSLSVPPDTLQEVLQAGYSFRNEPSMVKAVRYAAASVPGDMDTVLDMAAKASLRNFIHSLEAGASTTNIFQLGRTREHIQDFLKAEIGPEIWESLSEYSQNDLVEAEQYWGLSHFELGTKKREDWGSLVAVSQRPIDAELRDQLRSMFDRIENETGYQIKERTLGGCLSAIREAKKSKKMSPALALCVRSMTEFFDKHASFLESYRNWAVHAERRRPISAQELLKWRMMILKHGIFEVIVKTARELKAKEG